LVVSSTHDVSLVEHALEVVDDVGAAAEISGGQSPERQREEAPPFNQGTAGLSSTDSETCSGRPPDGERRQVGVKHHHLIKGPLA
jgi:hypothetical protein